MRTIIELDTNEIKEAIAEKYGCDVGQIDLRTKREPLGYGIGEAFSYTTIARIDKDRTTNSPQNHTDLTASADTAKGLLNTLDWNRTDATHAVCGVVKTQS